MVGRFSHEEDMTPRKQTKLIRERDLVAEIDVELLHEDDADGPGWGPYLSLADAQRLESVRRALRAGDLAEAQKSARVYRLTPVSAA
jgi:hypothetical protein